MPIEKKQLSMKDIQKFDPTPLYLYTARDALNRVTVLKEANKDAYLIRSEEHTSELQSLAYLVCRLLLEKKKKKIKSQLNKTRHQTSRICNDCCLRSTAL